MANGCRDVDRGVSCRHARPAGGRWPGLVSAEFPQKQQELFEGIVGLVAVGILSSMVFWMRKVARSIKHSLHSLLDHA